MPRKKPKYGDVPLVLDHERDVTVLVPKNVPPITDQRRKMAILRATNMARALLKVAGELRKKGASANPALLVVVERIRPHFLGSQFGPYQYRRMVAIEAVRQGINVLRRSRGASREVHADSIAPLVARSLFDDECPELPGWLTLEQWAMLANAWLRGRSTDRGRIARGRPTGGKTTADDSRKWVAMARILNIVPPMLTVDEHPAIAGVTLEGYWDSWCRVEGRVFGRIAGLNNQH